MYQADNSAIFYSTAEDFYEFAMIHGINEALEVKVYYVCVACVDYLLDSSYRIMAASSRAEAIASPGELFLIYRTQNLVNGLLHQTVYHGGDSYKGASCHCPWGFLPF